MSLAQDLILQLQAAVTGYETQITSQNVEIARLKTLLPPSGVVNVVITGVDMKKVTFS